MVVPVCMASGSCSGYLPGSMTVNTRIINLPKYPRCTRDVFWGVLFFGQALEVQIVLCDQSHHDNFNTVMEVRSVCTQLRQGAKFSGPLPSCNATDKAALRLRTRPLLFTTDSCNKQ